MTLRALMDLLVRLYVSSKRRLIGVIGHTSNVCHDNEESDNKLCVSLLYKKGVKGEQIWTFEGGKARNFGRLSFQFGRLRSLKVTREAVTISPQDWTSWRGGAVVSQRRSK